MTVPPATTLPQLLHPATYRPCEWDLAADPSGRAYWVGLFITHLDLLTDLIVQEYPRTNGRQVAAFRRDYVATMQSFEADPERFAPADVLRLTALRRDLLTRHGFPDPFLGVKQRENEAALALLPGVLAELEALPANAQLEALTVGLMAGNIFDLGSPATIAQYQAGLAGFREARARQPARPWLMDDLEPWQARWRDAPYRHVFWFVDNAGSDIWLGCIPLVRWMLRAGARVTLAANSGPALNDITASELVALLPQAGAAVPDLGEALAGGRLAVVATGSDLPLLDLTRLDARCTAAAADADLIILHGMGRGIESNFSVRLRCDSLHTASLKDAQVAGQIGGRLFDCVCALRPGGCPQATDVKKTAP
jgi:type II pantothenate kinase